MTLIQTVIAFAVDLLIAGALAGLLVRRRYATCYSFTLQLFSVLVSDILILAWPERFYTMKFWLLKDAFLHLLTFAIALELTLRTFRAFPGARWTARRTLAAVFVLTILLAILALPPLDFAVDTLAGGAYARLVNGAVWLFTAIAALILWYRLPVDPFQKAILIGFVPYLLVFTVGLNAVQSYGWDRVRVLVGYAEGSAYLLVMAYWALAAWHPSQVPAQAPEATYAAVERPT